MLPVMPAKKAAAKKVPAKKVPATKVSKPKASQARAAAPKKAPAKRPATPTPPAPPKEADAAKAKKAPAAKKPPVERARVVSAGEPRTKTRVERTRVVSAGEPRTKPPVERTRVVSAGEPRTKTRVERTRVVFPKDWYEPRKDDIKAPFKAQGMKWSYLGEGKGLYKREKEIHCFTQFLDDGTHYSLWGEDKKGVQAILDAWRKLAGEELYAQFTSRGEAAVKAEEEQKGSEAERLWKLGEPKPRPGEPDFFFKKRHDDWLAKKPAA